MTKLGGQVANQRAGALWRQEMAELAVILYGQGHSYREVARKLTTRASIDFGEPRKLSYMWVKRAVDKAMADRIERTREATDGWVNRELASLRSMEQALAEKVAAGDAEAIRTRLQIMDRRSKYLGLDVPVEVNATVTAVPAGLSEQIEEARARNLAAKQALVASVALPGAEVVTAELID